MALLPRGSTVGLQDVLIKGIAGLILVYDRLGSFRFGGLALASAFRTIRRWAPGLWDPF